MFQFLRKKKYVLTITPEEWEKRLIAILNYGDSLETKEKLWRSVFTSEGGNYKHDIEKQEIIWEIETSFGPNITYKSNSSNRTNLFFHLSYEWTEERLLIIGLWVERQAWNTTLLYGVISIAFNCFLIFQLLNDYSFNWYTIIFCLLFFFILLWGLKSIYLFIRTTNFIEKYIIRYLGLIPINEFNKIEEIGSK